MVKDDNGSVFTVDSQGGMTTLVEGLAEPKDVCVHEGVCYVSETGAGRVVAVDSAGTISPILEGLADPRGLAAMGDELFVLDRGGRKLWSVNLKDGNRAKSVAGNLPTGADCPLDLAGGLCRGSDGNLLIAADGEGSILKFKRT